MKRLLLLIQENTTIVIGYELSPRKNCRFNMETPWAGMILTPRRPIANRHWLGIVAPPGPRIDPEPGAPKSENSPAPKTAGRVVGYVTSHPLIGWRDSRPRGIRTAAPRRPGVSEVPPSAQDGTSDLALGRRSGPGGPEA